MSVGATFCFRFLVRSSRLLLVVIGCSVFLVPSANADVGPVAYWRFDEGTGTTAADSSSYGSTVTLVNGPTWTTGAISGAVNFAAGSAYASVSGASSLANLTSTGMTVSAWLRPTSYNNGRVIDKSATGKGWSFITNSDGTVRFTADEFATTFSARNSSSSLTLNTWQHVTITWDGTANGSGIHIYLNGTAWDATGFTNGSGAVQNDAATLVTIGNRSDQTRPFIGSIDELRIYNRVLSSTEIQTLVDTQAPGTPTGPSATAASSSQINVSWTAVTDNVAVASYLVERCTGSSCTNFVQVAAPTTTAFNNTALSASTTYRYRVRATDAAGNFSGYSPIVSATTNAAVAGPVAYWRFDEGSGTTTADASGSGITGTLTGNTAWGTGRVGGAVSFASSSALVNFGAPTALSSLNSTGMTISAWVKPTTLSNSRILDKSATGKGWSFIVNSAGTIRFTGDEFATAFVARDSATALAINTWQHVTATWDGTTNGSGIHLYINGVLSDASGVTNGAGAVQNDSATTVTAGNRTDLTRPFNGSIDELQVYNRVLTLSEIRALADSQAPTSPGSPTATASGSSQINLSWIAATDNIGVTAYRIERCQGAGCTSFVAVATVTGTTYSNGSLAANTLYRFRVVALDAALNESVPSSIASSTTTSSGGGDSTPPNAPTSPSAVANSATQVTVSWTAATDNVAVTGYFVDRCTGSGCTTFATVAVLGVTTSYVDTGLTGSTIYRFRVRARDAAGNVGPDSTIASATTMSGNGTAGASSYQYDEFGRLKQATVSPN